MSVSHPAANDRRKLLSGLSKLLFLIGFIFISIPFVSSLFTGNKTNDEKFILSVPLGNLQPATLIQQSWKGRDIWIYTPTEEEIRHISNISGKLNTEKLYFVFSPYENKKKCQVRLEREFPAVLSEPCYGARFDAVGNKLPGTGHADQIALEGYDYLLEDKMLKIIFR